MIDPGRRSERRAELFEELASTLEAGLPLEGAFATLGIGTVRIPGQAVVDNLDAALTDLDPVDRAVLAAAEHQGGLPRALRHRAQRHHHRAKARRELTRRLLYPVVLVILVVLLWIWLEFLGFGSPWSFGIVWLASLSTVAAGLAFLHRRARLAAASRPETWPALGGLYADSAAVPYLESLAGLLGAGVRIDEAHGRALRTVPWAGARARLFLVNAALERGESYAAAMARAAVFDAETDRALQVAEQAGDLEDTATRLAARRTERLQRRIDGACKAVGTLAYLAAATLATLTIMDFYGGIASLRFAR